jgi:hypothetical protein
LPEQAAACPHCEFSLASAAQYFGELPKLEFPLTDLAGALGIWKKRTARDALLGMSETFPQLSFAAVLAECNARVPLGAHAFWLFNLGGLCAAQESGGLCRLVLLVLDVKHIRAACMIGYGLEPFVRQETLDRVAAAALPELQRNDCAAAIIAALHIARTEFANVAETIPRDSDLLEGGQTAGATGERPVFAY